ncbi:MerR family transcriptional regulator [Pseudoflavitalea rhizosphaerae]|uniref:MerR family transcriptional regulator n=1 Tax=Pseudoflavitalea rhizosphaerae TaxID=1884793 RepID=UPI001F49BA59|nr:MerR family transcriptional regulator [Pseudoflavitalea rhizosphaerae]
MDKKKYNQMGFDFGDADPAQESPAAGFRIKSLKPASQADAGETEQETDNQENFTAQSGVNGEEPSQPAVNASQPGLSIEPGTAKQENENNPNNDSEVIQNTPVVSEAEALAHTHEQSSEINQEQSVAEETTDPGFAEPVEEPLAATAEQEVKEEEKTEEGPKPEQPKAAVQPAPASNIPSRLTRPTQVYAVEETEAAPEEKKENRNIGFTPASQQVEKPVVVAEVKTESPVNEMQVGSEAEQLPVSTGNVEEQPVAVENNNTKEDEDYISDEPGYGVSFNTPEPEPELPKKSTRGRKSLKTLDAEASAMNIPEDSTLFKRQYYSIGEVAGMFGVNQSLLRFWENEFDIIQPRKNRKGDRHFRPVDIKNLELIYDLLRRRKLTIEGAKEFLKKNKQARERFEMIQSLQQIKGFLLEIKASL